MNAAGRMALWNDCAAGHEAFYEEWYQTEHLIERLGIPGFLLGRRYRAIKADAEFFTYYETTSPGVLTSPVYLERVNNPTVMTRKVMSGIFTNMSRTLCEVSRQQGRFRGGFTATVKLDAGADPATIDQLLAGWIDDVGIARAEVWTSVEDNTPPSEEEKLRGGDAKIATCLFIETLTSNAAHDVAAEVQNRLGSVVVETGVYGLMCENRAA